MFFFYFYLFFELPRKALLLCFNTILNTKRELLEDSITAFVTHVYPHCETDVSLIRQVKCFFNFDNDSSFSCDHFHTNCSKLSNF